MKELRIVTPENIALALELPSPIDRAYAFLSDLWRLVLMSTVIFVVVLLVTSVFAMGNSLFLVQVLLQAVLFFVFNGYFIYYELRQGRTPGKRKRGFRVVSEQGGFLPPSAIYIRNLMREIEIWMPLRLALLLGFRVEQAFVTTGVWPFLWLLLFLLFPFFDRKNRRVGDILAGTVVISLPEIKLEKDLVTENQHRYGSEEIFFSPEMLNIYGKRELQTLEKILRQLPRMAETEKQKLMSTLVHKISRKIGYQQTVYLSQYEKFLRSFYQQQRAYLEKKLVRGKSVYRKK